MRRLHPAPPNGGDLRALVWTYALHGLLADVTVRAPFHCLVPLSAVLIPESIWFGHISVALIDDQRKVEVKLALTIIRQ